MTELFFVYGTLQTGGYNNHILLDSKSLGPAVTEDKLVLLDGGAYPYMCLPFVVPGHVAPERLPVWGELFEVEDRDVVEDLHWLEGVPDHYIDRAITVFATRPREYVQVKAFFASPRTMRGIYQLPPVSVKEMIFDTGRNIVQERVYKWATK